jgi:hypothetical protein
MNREELVKLIIKELPELQNLSEDQGFYEYEKAFDTIMTELSRQILEANIGQVPTNHQKKTLYKQNLEKYR